MSALKYWLWLAQCHGLGGVGIQRVLEQFGTPENAYFADPREYDRIADLSRAAKNSLLNKSLDGAEQILESCERLAVRILTQNDAGYPERLRQLPDPPAVLYLKGRQLQIDEAPVIGIVGSRRATPYGIEMAGKFAMELSAAGAMIVSGIAQGIDAAAVRGALQAGGTPICVLGGGIDIKYPYENRNLYDDVAAAGLLVSEYPPGTPCAGSHFPIRNRIISGLSLGVLAVEGAERSGTLITARLALEQNRDVFAVPGNINAAMSRGTNLLIQRGCAKLVLKSWDILEEYLPLFPGKLHSPVMTTPEIRRQRLEELERQAQGQESAGENAGAKQTQELAEGRKEEISLSALPERFSDDERNILYALGDGKRRADDIIEATQIPARRVLSALTLLQIHGYVAQRPGGRYESLVVFKE